MRKPAFQVGDYVYFKNKQPGKWDLKWRPRYRTVHIECDGHFIHIKNQATRKIQSCNVTDIILEPSTEFWNIDTQFGRAGRYTTHLHYSTLFMLTPTTNSLEKELGESVIFSTSSTGISNMSLLDHNGTCFPRTPGTPLESF